MKQLGYPASFAIVTTALIVGAVAAFGRISSSALDTSSRGSTRQVTDSTQRAPIFAPAGAAEQARFAREDSVWRAEHARQFTLAELRARGDGRRSPREAMQDRVYRYRQQGERAKAIGELERWVASNPRDQAALLSLARLLNETGRTDAAVRRYRQLIAVQEGRQR